MKKIAAFLSVVFLVVLSGCLGPELKDCGTDRDCFMEAMEACEPAKVRNEMPALDGSTTTYMEVRGGTMDSCTFYYKFADATAPSDATAEERAAVMAIIGSDMTCVAPVQTFITGMQDGSFLTSCEGPLKDTMMGWIESVPSPSGGTPSGGTGGYPTISVESCYSDPASVTLLIRNAGAITVGSTEVFDSYGAQEGNKITDCTFRPNTDIASGDVLLVTGGTHCTSADMPRGVYFLRATGYSDAPFTC
jgi:hypothetical protein